MDPKEALRRAIDELARQREEIRLLRAGTREPIAIVGMACRLPGADTANEFWDLLARGGDAVSDVPRDRWDAAAYYDADPSAAGKMATRQGGFIHGVDRFDPQFFGIAPREAQSMDPQQRVLLEVAWEALEHAGIPPTDLYGSATSVFVGITCFDHAIRIAGADGHFNAYAGTGSALNMAAGRLSYVLGLTGPSMAVDTACSSSLVCLHLACQSLRQRESDAAIAGGVHLILSPEVMVSFSQARMLAPDGRSKTFDASADGYARGEGCGVVVLKRYSDAVAAGDTILGLIRGTAVNQDGPSGGLTVPNGASQQKVIRAALEAAKVEPQAVGYVEAHGTGTSLGDPIEIEALAAVYGEGRTSANPLVVGSAKTNIGHLEPAAGMAGLIKILLAFRHQEIPAHLHFHTPNPHIPWGVLPLKVAAGALPWPRGAEPRIAGLSAFGFSGTNAHVIVEEPPVVAPEGPVARPPYLLPLSARSEPALRELAARYAVRLRGASDAQLAAIAFTAGAGRAHFPHRMAAIVADAAEARERLASFARGETPAAMITGRAASAAYRRDAKDIEARLERACTRLADSAAGASGDATDALREVAAIYVDGATIDWARLYGGAVPARVELPTYPFQRERHWIEVSTAGASPPAFASWLFEMVWERIGARAADLGGCRGRRWVIVPGDIGLASDVRAALAGQGAVVSTAAAREAAAAGATDIVFIAGPLDADAAARSCGDLLTVIQDLAAASGPLPRVWVVTQGAFAAGTAMTEEGAAHAPLAAFARGLGLEHPEMFGRVIDLDVSSGAAAALLAEMLHDDVEDQIAVRDDGRYAQRVERITAPVPPADALRGDAVYLVTGGFGAIGLHVAADLARRGARHLCLIGRSGITTDAARQAVAALEAQGVHVAVAAADVADYGEMRAVIDDVTAHRPLAGVVHAAGVPGYIDIERLTAGTIEDVLRPKVQGAWVLHELTRGSGLDFFVCFSSIASAWGSRGQAHYGAANAFLDALAHLRREAGLPGVAINWGPWSGGGMTSAEAGTLLRRVGIRGLPPAPALEAFGALARGPFAQIVVADIDWALFKDSYEARGHRGLLERIAIDRGTDAPAGEAGALARELAATPPAERARLLTDIIQREVGEVLEIAETAGIDRTQGLFEMGMDSLTALELRTRLQTIVGRALPATLVFDYPNILAIAQLLAGDSAAGAPARAASPQAPPDTAPVDDLSGLSEEEAEARLLRKLESIH